MDLQASGTLTVPRGSPEEAPLVLQLGELLSVESRISEIAQMTPIKAPELMSVFNQAFSDLVVVIAQVQFEFERSKQTLNKVRAVCLIDKIPEQLKSKGLTSAKSPSGSEDLRMACLELDADYQAAHERMIQLKCTLTLLEGKKEAIDKAYSAVKKVYGDSSQYRHSPSLTVTNGFFREK